MKKKSSTNKFQFKIFFAFLKNEMKRTELKPRRRPLGCRKRNCILFRICVIGLSVGMTRKGYLVVAAVVVVVVVVAAAVAAAAARFKSFSTRSNSSNVDHATHRR